MRRREKILIENGRGEQLSALLELPVDYRPYAVAVFAHCFACNKNFSAMRNISRALQQEDIAVLRFDFTGLGESEGDFGETSFSSNLHDLVTAVNFMTERFTACPVILVGHSLGGAAVVHAASSIPEVQAIVTIGAPYEPGHVTHLLQDHISTIEHQGRAEVTIGTQRVQIGQEFLDDISKRSGEEAIAELRKPLLILHSPQDTIVGIDNAAKIYQAAHHPKSFISLNGADHLLTSKNDSMYVGAVISSWVKRYIPQPEEEAIDTDSRVAVRLSEDDAFTSDVRVRKHRLIADEPNDVGGYDLGPDPYEYVASGLAACTVMTLHMYTRRKKWPLEEAICHVDIERKHCEDCTDVTSEKGLAIIHFKRKLELKGDLSDDQKARCLQIADKCPVHKSLHGQIKIETSLI